VPAVGPVVVEAVDQLGNVLAPWMGNIASLLESPKNFQFAGGFVRLVCHDHFDGHVALVASLGLSTGQGGGKGDNSLPTVACKPYGRERPVAKLMDNLIPAVVESVVQVNWMIASWAIVLQLFSRQANLVLSRVDHFALKMTAGPMEKARGSVTNTGAERSQTPRQ